MSFSSNGIENGRIGSSSDVQQKLTGHCAHPHHIICSRGVSGLDASTLVIRNCLSLQATALLKDVPQQKNQWMALVRPKQAARSKCRCELDYDRMQVYSYVASAGTSGLISNAELWQMTYGG